MVSVSKYYEGVCEGEYGPNPQSWSAEVSAKNLVQRFPCRTSAVPGHAGDIATIIKDSTAASRGRVFMTDVLGMHPKLIELLVKRSKQAVALEVYASVNPAAGLGIPR